MSSIVMSGALGEFDVPSILQAVSLSRQCTRLRLWDSNKRETGEIRIKAGQLLDAICGQKRGRAALHSLLQAKHHSFRVERFGDSGNAPEPVGSLAALLLELPKQQAGAPRDATQQAVPVMLAPPAASATPTPAPTALPDDVTKQRLAALADLQQLLVVRPDGRGWEWTRDAAATPPGTLRRLATLVASSHAGGVPTWSTFETAASTVVVRGLGGADVVAYGFPALTPLGLVRMVVATAETIATSVDPGHTDR